MRSAAPTLSHMPTQEVEIPVRRPKRRRGVRWRFNLTVRVLVVCPLVAGAGFVWALTRSPGSAPTGMQALAGSIAGWALVSAALTLAVVVAVIRAARPLLAIRGAMAAIARGETDTAALRVDERTGPEAEAWNKHLQEVDRSREAARATVIAQTIAASRPGADALEQACGALWLGCVVVDSRERVVFCNGAAGRLLRTSPQHAIGSPIDEIIDDPEALAMVREAGASSGRKRCKTKAGSGDDDAETVLRFSATRAGSDAGSPLIILIEDLTQQHAADVARDTFVTQATHELRTPLTNIRLYAERAIEQGEDVLIRGECLNVINQEARRLERIVTDMLSASEIDAGSLQIEIAEVRLEALMDELKLDYDELARNKDITFTLELPPKLFALHADRDKLTMALHNLVGNAFKYTPAGGFVTVSVRQDESGLNVSVSDNGIGIRPEDQNRIFEKFYRVKDQRVSRISGSGLGLSLAREVIRLHGGQLTVQSEPDRGSTFTLSIPNRTKAA